MLFLSDILFMKQEGCISKLVKLAALIDVIMYKKDLNDLVEQELPLSFLRYDYNYFLKLGDLIFPLPLYCCIHTPLVSSHLNILPDFKVVKPSANSVAVLTVFDAAGHGWDIPWAELNSLELRVSCGVI